MDINTDITYCARECMNVKCFRNKIHTKDYNGYLSWSNFEDCEEYANETKDINHT